MKYSFLSKQLFLWLFLGTIYGEIHPFNDYAPVGSQDCNSCDLGCFDFQVMAGIAPIFWTRRDNFSAISCNASLGCPTSTVSPIVPLFEMPKFHNLYKLPWTVGGLLGYYLDDCTMIYIEGNYRQASAKHNFTVQSTVPLALFTLNPQFIFNSLSKYKFYDFYVGARYYFNPCWCECLSFFLGGQVGVIHHKAVDFNLITSSLSNPCAAPFTSTGLPLFGKHTNFAGGGNIGLEFEWCDCLVFVLTAEFIATCGAAGSVNGISFSGCAADAVLPELSPEGFIANGYGTEVIIPITLGLKYSF